MYTTKCDYCHRPEVNSRMREAVQAVLRASIGTESIHQRYPTLGAAIDELEKVWYGRGETPVTEILLARPDIAVWWLQQKDYEALEVMCDGHLNKTRLREHGIPEVIGTQVVCRAWRPGRGRLWVCDGIDCEKLAFDFERRMHANRVFVDVAGGIVFSRRYLKKLQDLAVPGLITDELLVTL